jgi:hypothetical protein
LCPITATDKDHVPATELGGNSNGSGGAGGEAVGRPGDLLSVSDALTGIKERETELEDLPDSGLEEASSDIGMKGGENPRPAPETLTNDTEVEEVELEDNSPRAGLEEALNELGEVGEAE